MHQPIQYPTCFPFSAISYCQVAPSSVDHVDAKWKTKLAGELSHCISYDTGPLYA